MVSWLIVTLMLVAAVYASSMAIVYWPTIGV